MGIMLSTPVVNSIIAGSMTALGTAAVFCMHEGSSAQALLLAYAAGVMGVVSVQDMLVPQLVGAQTQSLGWAYAICVVVGMMLMFVLGMLVPSDVAVSLPFFAGAETPGSQSAALPGAKGDAPGNADHGDDAGSEDALLEVGEAGGVRSRGGHKGAKRPDAGPGASAGGAPALPAPAERGPAPGDGGKSRLAVVMCAALTLHNLPEGVAVAASSMASASAGERLTVAIAIHNAVEGAALAVPVVAATGSVWKALAATLLSGMTEPLGAAVTLLAMGQAGAGSDAGPGTAGDLRVGLACTLCAAAGVMLQVCGQELVPEAWAAARAGGKGGAGMPAAALVGAGLVLGGLTMPALTALEHRL